MFTVDSSQESIDLFTEDEKIETSCDSDSSIEEEEGDVTVYFGFDS